MVKKSQVLGEIDWYNMPIEEVFENLGSGKDGLTNGAVQERLGIFGPNKTEDEKESNLSKLLRVIRNPRLAATIIVVANGWGQHPNLPIIVCSILPLVIPDLPIRIEKQFPDLISMLMAPLSRKVKVRLDGRWSEKYASFLVPGDVIIIKAGDIIPADARLLYGGHLIIDQSALIGDSSRVMKGAGDAVYAGCVCEQGESEAIIVATGVRSSFRKMTHLDDATNKVTQLDKVLTAIRNVCICFVAVGMLVEIFIMYPFQHRAFRLGIDNLLVLLIGGIPIIFHETVMLTILRGAEDLDRKGAILKRPTLIKEMADMDVLCSDTAGTLTLNKLTVDKNLIEVFAKGVDPNLVVLLAARACRTENRDTIDAAIVGLADPKEAWTGIQEVTSQPSNLTDKQTALTYIDSDGKLHRVCKGAPQQILNLAHNKKDIEGRVHAVTERFKERGWHSLAVAYQEVTDGMKDNPEGAWHFIGVIPLFENPRHDTADVLVRAFDLSINVKMITGDRLEMAKETGRCLGMGTNMYSVSSLLEHSKDNDSVSSSSIDDLIEKADGFADVLPEHKYEIVKRLQARKHICAITGHGPTDSSALKKADIGIAVANATDAARRASDIVLTEPGVNVVIRAVSICRKISHRIKEYSIHTVSTIVHTVLGFLLLALIWEFDFPPYMLLFIVMFNDGLCGTYASFRVKCSATPDCWGLAELLKTGVVRGCYLAVTSVVFFWVAHETDFFQRVFGVASLEEDDKKLAAAMYLQVSITSQSLVFLTRSRKWSLHKSRKWLRLIWDGAFVVLFVMSQLVATLLAVYAHDWNFPAIEGIGWGWSGVIWLYNIIVYIPLFVIEVFTPLSPAKDACAKKEVLGKGSSKHRWTQTQTIVQVLEPAMSKV